MKNEIISSGVKEIKNSKIEGYRNIKPEHETPLKETFEFWDSEFKKASEEAKFSETPTPDKNSEISKTPELKELIKEYIVDMKGHSECSDTIPDKPFDLTDLKKLSPEENEKMRDEFDGKKDQLIKEWEKTNERSWPRYEQDVYSSHGKLIRRQGDPYDAHHIQPLGMGGKNEVSNITPMHVDVHYDKQGVHAPDSPYEKIKQRLGESDL